VKFYKVTAIPPVFSSKTWTLKGEELRIEVAEMWYLRTAPEYTHTIGI
jgi:hypothetical protein